MAAIARAADPTSVSGKFSVALGSARAACAGATPIESAHAAPSANTAHFRGFGGVLGPRATDAGRDAKAAPRVLRLGAVASR